MEGMTSYRMICGITCCGQALIYLMCIQYSLDMPLVIYSVSSNNPLYTYSLLSDHPGCNALQSLEYP